MRWGILGTGYIAGLFVSDLQECGHDVVAVGSRSSRSADEFAARFGIPQAHPDYRALYGASEVDAIYIATPNPFHARNAIDALAAGKHVLLEKPFTMTRADALDVFRAADDADRVVMEAMWSRFLPHALRAHELVASGVVGDALALEADLSQRFPFDPAHRQFAPELGGGVLLDLGVYVVSLAVRFFGAPDAETALVTTGPSGVDVRASIALRHGGGQHSSLHVGLDGRGPMTADLIGSDGRIRFDEPWHRAGTLSVFDADGREVDRFAPEVRGRGMQYQAAEFERLVAEGLRESPVMPRAETLAVVGVLERLRASV